MLSNSPLLRCLVLALSVAAVSALDGSQRFRITFGGGDSAVVDWSGSVSVSAGSAAIAASHHFGPAETFDGSSWKCGNQWDGGLQMEPKDQAVFPLTRWKGIVLDIDGGDSTVVAVTTAQGDSEFRSGDVKYHQPIERLDGRVRIERVPVSQRMSESLADDDYPAIAIGPDGRVWVAWIAFEDGADTIQLRSSEDGETWTPAVTMPGPPGDYHQVALASTGTGAVTAVASRISEGVVHLYGIDYALGGELVGQALTRGPGPDTFPRMAASPDGDVHLVYQSGADGNTDISLMVRRDGEWSGPDKGDRASGERLGAVRCPELPRGGRGRLGQLPPRQLRHLSAPLRRRQSRSGRARHRECGLPGARQPRLRPAGPAVDGLGQRRAELGQGPLRHQRDSSGRERPLLSPAGAGPGPRPRTDRKGRASHRPSLSCQPDHGELDGAWSRQRPPDLHRVPNAGRSTAKGACGRFSGRARLAAPIPLPWRDGPSFRIGTTRSPCSTETGGLRRSGCRFRTGATNSVRPPQSAATETSGSSRRRTARAIRPTTVASGSTTSTRGESGWGTCPEGPSKTSSS